MRLEAVTTAPNGQSAIPLLGPTPGRRRRHGPTRTGGNASAGISSHLKPTSAPPSQRPPSRPPTPGVVVTTPAPIGCSYPDCQQTARGRVAAPVLLDVNLGDRHGFVIVRPVGTHLTKGAPY